jgi:hypothetical protein
MIGVAGRSLDMVYIDIPYAVENQRIERGMMQEEIGRLKISDEAKRSTLAAIYNFKPRGVEFAAGDMSQVKLLEEILIRVGIPFRQMEQDPAHA